MLPFKKENHTYFLLRCITFKRRKLAPLYFIDIEERDLAAYQQDMIVCYTSGSLHLRLRNHRIFDCKLDISVYDSVFRHRRFWSMLTMYPRNPN